MKYIFITIVNLFLASQVYAQCPTSCISLNTFVGSNAGQNNSGQASTFIGANTGINNSGTGNSFLGHASGEDNTSGQHNTFIGEVAGRHNTTGDNNTFLGNSAGFANTTGSQNVFIGHNAGPFPSQAQNNQSSKLYINNAGGTNPLIYGEFDSDLVRINGEFHTTGNTGIGTSAPSARLHVDGLINQNPIRVDLAGETKLHVSTTGGTSIGTFIEPPSDGLAVSGDTGLGTSTPGQRLEVVGAIKIGTTSTNSNGSIRYNGTRFQGYHNGTWINLDEAIWTESGSNATFSTGNIGIGTNNPQHLLHVAGDVAISGSFISPSDVKLKEDIQPIENALEMITQLEPKMYNYTAEKVKEFGLSTAKEYGLIAQELELVLPHLVNNKTLIGHDGEIYKGVDYVQLIPILVQTIKDMEDNNKSLKSKVTSLEKRKIDTDRNYAELLKRLIQLENKSE